MGVARQYCGRLGKVANCQAGMFLAYVSPLGRALVDKGLYLPESWTSDKDRCGSLVDVGEWARELYETAKVAAPSPTMRVRDLGPPLPSPSDTVPIWRGMKAERNAELLNSPRYLARLPGAVVRALIVYLLGVPIFWFAIMDLFLFVDRGESLLGPAMDAILVVFGSGLIIVSLVAVMTVRPQRKRAVSR